MAAVAEAAKQETFPALHVHESPEVWLSDLGTNHLHAGANLELRVPSTGGGWPMRWPSHLLSRDSFQRLLAARVQRAELRAQRERSERRRCARSWWKMVARVLWSTMR